MTPQKKAIVIVALAASAVAISGVMHARPSYVIEGGMVPRDTVVVSGNLDSRAAEVPVVWRRTLRSDSVFGGMWTEPVIRGAALAGDTLLVANEQDHEVMVLDSRTGALKGKIGGFGQDSAHFWLPGSAARWRGQLWVSDGGNRRLVGVADARHARSIISVEAQPRTLMLDSQTLLAVLFGQNGFQLYALGDTGAHLSRVARVPSYRSLLSATAASDGSIAMLGSVDALDIYPPTALPRTLVFRIREHVKLAHNARATERAARVLRVASVQGNPSLWWTAFDNMIGCVDSKDGTLVRYWSLPPTLFGPQAIAGISATDDGVVAFYAASGEVARYKISCARNA